MPTQKHAGFTIVELLIVVVVIAILSVISLVTYSNLQNRAHDSAVQSDLRNISQKIMEYHVTTGKLPSVSANFTPMALQVAGNSYGNHYTPAASNGYNAAYCLDVLAGSFAIVAASKSGKVYVLKNGSL